MEPQNGKNPWEHTRREGIYYNVDMIYFLKLQTFGLWAHEL